MLLGLGKTLINNYNILFQDIFRSTGPGVMEIDISFICGLCSESLLESDIM